ncbi:MAG: hypothetical protein BHW60_01170 [Sutterella sp. 54_7]|nr:MAG: hypothetical protein BHW60_01170 [Sutterella sp. 54_7]
MKEYRALLPLIEKFREYKKTENDIAGAKALLDEGDPEMREMAQEELRCGKERLAVLEEELKLLLLPRDPNDDTEEPAWRGRPSMRTRGSGFGLFST